MENRSVQAIKVLSKNETVHRDLILIRRIALFEHKTLIHDFGNALVKICQCYQLNYTLSYIVYQVLICLIWEQ